MPLGVPHLHLRLTDSTNARARELAAAGAPHGTTVTAAEQSAGRGRQGRSWAAPAGSSLLLSVLIRDPPALLPLAAGLAVARACGPQTSIKWPNDVQLGGCKVAGVLVEGRPQEHWAIVGAGINAAFDVRELPPELHERAGTLRLPRSELPRLLESVLAELERALKHSPAELLNGWRERDALLGQVVRWDGGSGRAAGLDDEGRLLVELDGGGHAALSAGEVHLGGG